MIADDSRRYIIECKQSRRWLHNIPARYAGLVRLAAKAAAFNVYIGAAIDAVSDVPQVGVYSRQPERDHGPFWAEYHRLKAAMEHTDEMPVL